MILVIFLSRLLLPRPPTPTAHRVKVHDKSETQAYEPEGERDYSPRFGQSNILRTIAKFFGQKTAAKNEK